MRKIEPRDIMRYYVTYFDIEKNIIEKIHDLDNNIVNNAYYVYVNKHMKIGRNFKPRSADMVLVTIENMLTNEGNLGVEELSNRYVRNDLVSKSTIKNVKVAASKLLWLFDKETIIMDNNNMKVLKANNYKEYVKKWSELYNLKVKEINEVIDKNFKELDKVITQNWFKMRIFDQYLLSIYNEQKATNKFKSSIQAALPKRD